MTTIIDIESNLDLLKEYHEKYLKKLDMNSSKLRIADEWGNQQTLDFENAKKTLDNYSRSKKYYLALENALKIIGELPGRFSMIKEELDHSFAEILKIIDMQNGAIENLQEELSLKESQLIHKENKIEQLKEQFQNQKFEILQSQLNALTTGLVTKQPKKDKTSPDKYFTEEIEDNLYDEEPNSSINSQLQEAHEEILDLLKGEGLYPLHHIDTQKAREKYLELWKYIIPNYDIEEQDYPKFIDNLEKYADKPENYLDNVEVDK